MFLIDSHCHLDRLNYNLPLENIEDVLKKSYQNHVKNFLTVSTCISNFYNIKKLFKKYNTIFYSCGVHPLNCKKELNLFHTIENLSNEIKKLSCIKDVIALGETGLDYYYSSATKKIQQDFFREHIRVAIKLKKPIIVHSRNASEDTIKILQEENAEKCKGVLHSFTGDYNTACKLLDLGFYISCSGIITFKNSLELCKTIRKIPLNRLLIETDSPYLSPAPYRGKGNQPAYLFYIAEYLSILKEIDIHALGHITTSNFRTLFNI
ncbi:TatD family hydrolase [Buchnera aphidicola]|uniref:TatD family hydrolase n=1 Tax=Buchnera aphidicola TaxID=9 RepID=UPI000189C6CB|nr:YchF/TatD family DNA exonuclease [Buchnera aphidicola]ADP66747.1 predicted metallodependent hydrolase (YcfH) [Buchnera aphidicola str. TLW03 (Acyrthosiphon pisum)]ADP67848.1 predicted metallodependent hydrolase (YcfH) [Buchnera aphidicola str. JF98 (Acyrthosiphon pisum)]ACL30157.1 predicted metallodependent hydrolase (YcfH) [Buchnera aphidicola str. Tuc7 (Acyrthosiphon pisum)]ADP66174.1 predicted metallodependent hydrolase (YcfH) [Buchnera aphidicola str. LL01 (Acyrthosiphon pisum)]ADP67330